MTLMSATLYTSRTVCTGMMLLLLSAIRLRSSEMWRLRAALGFQPLNSQLQSCDHRDRREGTQIEGPPALTVGWKVTLSSMTMKESGMSMWEA